MGWGRILAAHPVQRCPTPTESWSLPGLAGASRASRITVMLHCHEQLRKPLTQHAKNYQTTNRRPQATPLLSNSGIRSGCFAHPSAGKPFWPRPRGRWKVSQAWQSNHAVFKLHWPISKWSNQHHCFHDVFPCKLVQTNKLPQLHESIMGWSVASKPASGLLSLSGTS